MQRASPVLNKGDQIKFVITNNGAFDHEFILDSVEHNAKHKIAMEKDPEMKHDDANGMRFAASKSGEILWKFSKAGRYEFACLSHAFNDCLAPKD